MDAGGCRLVARLNIRRSESGQRLVTPEAAQYVAKS
jgi:hypothetical protein